MAIPSPCTPGLCQHLARAAPPAPRPFWGLGPRLCPSPSLPLCSAPWPVPHAALASGGRPRGHSDPLLGSRPQGALPPPAAGGRCAGRPRGWAASAVGRGCACAARSGRTSRGPEARWGCPEALSVGSPRAAAAYERPPRGVSSAPRGRGHSGPERRGRRLRAPRLPEASGGGHSRRQGRGDAGQGGAAATPEEGGATYHEAPAEQGPGRRSPTHLMEQRPLEDGVGETAVLELGGGPGKR